MVSRILSPLVCTILVAMAFVIILAPRGLAPPVAAQTMTVASLPSPFVKAAPQAGEGHGSAVAIGGGFYVTAAHVAVHGPLKLIREDGASQDAETLWMNDTYDLALLHDPDASFTGSVALSCAASAPGSRLISHGNPEDLDSIDIAGVVAGKPRMIGPWKLVVPLDMTVVQGMSGGGVTNDQGELAGIAVGTMASNGAQVGIGVMVPSSVLCYLLGRP